MLYLSVIVMIIMTVAFVTVPVLKDIFIIGNIDYIAWVYVLATSMILFFFDMLLKIFMRDNQNKFVEELDKDEYLSGSKSNYLDDVTIHVNKKNYS
jgi:hypothetical protein